MNGVTNQIDKINWKVIKNINYYLPKSLKINNIQNQNTMNDVIFSIEPFTKFLNVLQKVPGYSIEIFLKRIPRLINEPYAKEMSFKIARNVTEKSVVRLVKLAAGTTI